MRIALAVLASSALAALSAGCDSGAAAGTADDAGGTIDGGALAPDAATVTTTPACTGREALTGNLRWTLSTGGRERTFDVHLPPSYDPTRPTPLVLNFHGLGSNAGQQEIFSRMLAKSDSAGFIAVHPEGIGTRQSWNAGGCCEAAMMENVDDVGFVRALLDHLEDKLCVDTTHIFATGMSNGGFMSHRLGCEVSDRIAAIAPVAGHMVLAACSPARPMPVVHFHGTADTIVPYAGNPQYGFPSVDSTMQAWAARNGCQSTTTETFDMGDTVCKTWDGCGAGETILCTVDGGGHTWPGGFPVASLGKTTTALSATDMMWEFFLRHPLPVPPRN